MLSPHWGNILSVLDALLAQLKAAHVPAFLVRKLFQQLFSFVNVQLFNQLLLRRECCSFSNGEYVKTGLAEVENWIASAGKDWVGESWEELRYIRQVFLWPAASSSAALCPIPLPRKLCCTPASLNMSRAE
jgi:myosin-5